MNEAVIQKFMKMTEYIDLIKTSVNYKENEDDILKEIERLELRIREYGNEDVCVYQYKEELK